MVRRKARSPTPAPTDATLRSTLEALLAARKEIARPLDWVNDRGDLRASLPLSINGATAAGLSLFARAHVDFPDRKLSLGLAWRDTAGHGGTFARIDWRPLAPHNNKGLAPPEWRFIVQHGSQHHPLGLNADHSLGLAHAIANNLPIAEALAPDPTDWAALCASAERLWRIRGLVGAPMPPWQYGLLEGVGGGQPRRRKR